MIKVPHSFLDEFQRTAGEQGFPLFGVTKATQSPGFARFCCWLDKGYAGEMEYLSKRRSAYQHPSNVLKNVQSLVMLGMPYQPAVSLRSHSARRVSAGTSPADPPLSKEVEGFGRVAAYATGTVDYHDLIHDRLNKLTAWLIERFPTASVRGVVDTAPLLERDFAALAGLGWIGKNTLLLNQNAGSYFFLAALLTDIFIDFQPNSSTDHCGTCTACMDACPTQAFPEPHVLDATRCISYLTIENRGSIPVELRAAMGNWVFGCDVCQQICPWNRMAMPTGETLLKPQNSFESLDLIELLSLDEVAFRKRYRKTPLWRARRFGMQRNAIIVLGNQKNKQALSTIAPFLMNENETLRGIAAWAIGQIGGEPSHLLLLRQLSLEQNDSVRQEIEEAVIASRCH